MSGSLAFRLGAIALASLAVVVAALQARRGPTPGPGPAAAPPAAAVASPAVPDPALARCQALGAAGAQDAACLKAWADERHRFLGRRGKGR